MKEQDYTCSSNLICKGTTRIQKTKRTIVSPGIKNSAFPKGKAELNNKGEEGGNRAVIKQQIHLPFTQQNLLMLFAIKIVDRLNRIEG